MCANLVASPKQIGNRPLASGSSVPVCPAFSARNRRFACCNAALDDSPTGLSRSRTPSTRRRKRGDVLHPRMFCSARVLAVFGDGVVDQLGQAKARLDGVVIDKMKLWHRIQLESVRKLGAQVSGGMLQGRDSSGRVLLAGQMREKNLGVREVGRHFDRGDRDHADAGILDMESQQIGKLALDLIADALRAL